MSRLSDAWTAFRGVYYFLYLGALLGIASIALACISAGSVWVKGSRDGCRAWFSPRSYEVTDCDASGKFSYSSCGEGFCNGCKTSGQALICFVVFGVLSSMTALLMTLKRRLGDAPKDWAGRHIRWVTAGSFLSASVFWFLGILSFLGGCEGRVKSFDNKSPHTGFALLFLAMCGAFGAAACSVISRSAQMDAIGADGSGAGEGDPVDVKRGGDGDDIGSSVGDAELG